MPTIIDKEFGNITLKRSTKASSVRIRLAPNGELRISAPLYTPVYLVKRFINSSRPQLQKLLHEHRQSTLQLENGMSIGKSHSLIVRPTSKNTTAARHQLQIIVMLNNNQQLNEPDVVTIVKKVIIDAHRLEAKSYLPKRLAFLANKHGFNYERLRFSHASGRWGSCSTNGTISLNIALMKLPFELIDYVLLHELAHTREMNHSTRFWSLVEQIDPQYKVHRKILKAESPSI